KEKKKPVIFVSGDTKNDWVVKTGTTIIAPRYELLDEFRRHSKGQGFYFISLSELLALHGATKESIREVQAVDEAETKANARTALSSVSLPTNIRTTSRNCLAPQSVCAPSKTGLFSDVVW